MLDKFTEFLDTKLSTSMARLAEQRHLRAVRDGIVASLPLIIVGSFFLILAFPPLPDSWGGNSVSKGKCSYNITTI
ncbi:TPA: hypothetical protein ACG3H2_002119 [Clostridioides difficile]